MQNHWGMTRDDKIVGWLPLFHDMGLIGTFLVPMYIGIDVVLMNPSAFLRRPIEWLRTISDYKGTFSPAPNFAYALVAARVSKDDLKDIDLSTWRAAICGARSGCTTASSVPRSV